MKVPSRGFALLSRMIVAAAAVILPPSFAHSDFQLCNRMSYVFDIAVGLQDAGALVTRGWRRIEPGQCRVAVEGTISADRFFVHARTPPAYGASPVAQTGQTELCVGRHNFVIPAATRGCSRSGQQPALFAEVKPSQTETGWTANLAEEAEYTEEQARLAGIQRLLIMNGYDASPIDGLKGPKTDAALAAFLKDRGLPSDRAGSADFFDLLLDAAQKPEGTGFVWCNETKHSVMAAVGSEDRGVLVTRGWYRVEPGKCTRPDVQGKPRRIYSYAEAVDASGQVINRGGKLLIWGGKTSLCTRLTAFELGDHKECGARGLTAAGFAAVDVAPQGATTIRFQEP